VAEPFPRTEPAGSLVWVTVRYWAAARAAAGVAEERLTLTGPADLSTADIGGVPSGEVTVGTVLAEASDLHGPGLARVLQRCSFLLDEVAVHGVHTVVRDGQVLDVLPPFAGG
jgi:molybdopterin synthase sulfur carrier subunit